MEGSFIVRLVIFLLLTSGSAALCAPTSIDPTTPAKKSETKTNGKDASSNQESAPEPKIPESMEIAPAPLVSDNPHLEHVQPPFIYPYESALSARIGTFESSKDVSTAYWLVGGFWMFGSESMRHTEIGGDLTSNHQGYLNWAQKWVFEREARTRYSLKAGVSLKWDPSEEIAAPIALKNYQIRGGATLEHSIQNPGSLRVDLEIGQSTIETFGLVSLGYSFGL